MVYLIQHYHMVVFQVRGSSLDCDRHNSEGLGVLDANQRQSLGNIQILACYGQESDGS